MWRSGTISKNQLSPSVGSRDGLQVGLFGLEASVPSCQPYFCFFFFEAVAHVAEAGLQLTV